LDSRVVGIRLASGIEIRTRDNDREPVRLRERLHLCRAEQFPFEIISAFLFVDWRQLLERKKLRFRFKILKVQK